MANNTAAQPRKSKKMILMVPDVVLCLVSWAVIWFWYKSTVIFWLMMAGFLALFGAILVSGFKKKRNGNPKWSSFVFVWSFLLCLIPTTYMIITIFTAILGLLPD